MNITHSQNTNTFFKAHFYKTKLHANKLSLEEIQTDNRPYLGEEPELIITDGSGYEDLHLINYKKAKPIKMQKENGMYSAKAHSFLYGYKLYYKDTKKYDDNNGQNYNIDFDKMTHKAFIKDKVLHNQPLEAIISKGTVTGKLVHCKDINKVKIKDTKTPLILYSENNNDYINPYILPKNTVGVILINGSTGKLNHTSSTLRNHYDMIASIYDKDKIDELKNLNGNFIEASTLNNKLELSKIQKEDVKQSQEVQKKIEIPEMRYSDSILTPKEYELDTVGPKAYKLRLMSEMSEKGKLQDVIIPDSIALTHGFLDKMQNCKDTEKYGNSVFISDNNPYLLEVFDAVKQNGLNPDVLIARSSFNGEDVDGYSAAGLYDSIFTDIGVNTGLDIFRVVNSKNNERAIRSRRMNNISDEIIKPTVIIQNRIKPDYHFTIYTKDSTQKDDVLTIEMNTKYDSSDPYILQFNKKTKKLQVCSTERRNSYFTFDENGNIIKSELEEDKLAKEWKTMKPVLKKVIKNALVLEKEFGKPQDIEGGIKDGQIYFWQTRNIVK